MPRALAGQGRVEVAANRERVWSALLDPAVLRSLIPGADQVERLDHERYDAALSFGVGRLRGRYGVRLQLSNVMPPHALDLAGQAHGWLGAGRASAHVELTQTGLDRMAITWRYDGVVAGPVAIASRALLRATSNLFVQRFFVALARHVATDIGSADPAWLRSEAEGG